jgi:hypothetical protein
LEEKALQYQAILERRIPDTTNPAKWETNREDAGSCPASRLKNRSLPETGASVQYPAAIFTGADHHCNLSLSIACIVRFFSITWVVNADRSKLKETYHAKT